MRDRMPTARMYLVELMRSVSMLKTHATIFLGDLFNATGHSHPSGAAVALRHGRSED